MENKLPAFKSCGSSVYSKVPFDWSYRNRIPVHLMLSILFFPFWILFEFFFKFNLFSWYVWEMWLNEVTSIIFELNLKYLHDCCFMSFVNVYFAKLSSHPTLSLFFFLVIYQMSTSLRALLSLLWYRFKTRVLFQRKHADQTFLHPSRLFAFLISKSQTRFACNPVILLGWQVKSLNHPPASQCAAWAFACEHFTSHNCLNRAANLRAKVEVEKCLGASVVPWSKQCTRVSLMEFFLRIQGH